MPSLVAHTSAGAVSAAPSTVTTGAIDTTGATLLIVGAQGWNPSTTISASDSALNTWSALPMGGVNSTFCGQLFYCISPTASATHTFTIKDSVGTGGGFWAMFVQAWSGMSSIATDGNSGAAYSSATSAQPGSITPAHSGDLIVSLVGVDAAETIAVNSTFTISDTVPFSSGAHEGGALAYLVQTSAAAINPTWSWGAATNGTSEIAAFSFTGAAPPAPTPAVPRLMSMGVGS